MDKKILLFLVKFFLIFGVLEFIILNADLGFVQEPIAKLEGALSGLEAEGINLIFSEGYFIITPSCTGFVSASILAAIIFSLKKPAMGKKFLLLAAGTVLLFAVNIFRIYFVLLAGINYGGAAAEAMHQISWFLTAAAIIFAWHYLTKKVTGVKEFYELL